MPDRRAPARPEPVPGPVADGVWSVPLPFPNPLRYTYAYLVEVRDGMVLVDAGWNSETCWTALVDGVAAAGAGLDDITGVVITHVHPDHYGLAGCIREHTSAWIGVHERETDRILRGNGEFAAVLQEMVDWLYICGAPEEEAQALRDDGERITATTPTVSPDVLLHDGQQVPGAPSMTAIHTPGHTPGHLCFLDEDRRVMFTGDHILPRITPNVSQRPQQGEDPLGHFRRSIAKVRGLGAVLGLPGHEWPIADVDARIDDLVEHHRERLDQVEAALRDGAATVWEVATSVTWSRQWDTLRGLQRRSALGETHSHLERLTREGRVRRMPGMPDRWSVRHTREAPAAASPVSPSTGAARRGVNRCM